MKTSFHLSAPERRTKTVAASFPILAIVIAWLLFPASLFAGGREITTPTFGPTARQTSAPVVATNGDTFLTVWLEDNHEVHGSLADRQGRVITDVSLSILTVSDPVFDGGFGLTAVGKNYELVFATYKGLQLARLSPDGTLVSQAQLATQPYPPSVKVASNGESLLVVAPSSSSQNAQDIAYLIGADNTVIRSQVLGPSRGSIDVIAQGREYVVAAWSGSSIMMHRIGADGSVLRSSPVAAIGNVPTVNLSLAPRGNDVLLLWNVLGDYEDPHLTLVARNGSVLSTSDIGGATRLRSVALRSTATGYVATFYGCPTSATCGSYLTRLDALGVPVDAIPFPVAAYHTSAAALDSTVVLAASRPTTIAVDLSTMKIASATISISPAVQREPSLASNGVDFFATFTEETLGRSPARAARFSRGGTPLDGPGITLASESGQAFTATAYGDSTYVAVWNDLIARTLFARRFDTTGTPIDATPISLGPADGYESPAVSWNGTNFLVVWPQQTAIAGVLLPSRGNPPNASIQIAAPANSEQFRDLDVASDGAQFLVTWVVYSYRYQICDACGPNYLEARATGVDANGRPFHGSPVVLKGPQRLRLASSGSEYLLALDAAADVSTAVAHTEGGVVRIDPPKIQVQFTGSASSDVLWDGRDYVLVWRFHAGSDSFLGSMRIDRTNSSSDRRSLKTGPTTSASSIGNFNQSDPAVAVNSLGDVVVVTSESNRLRSYFVSEMGGFPPSAQSPRNVRATLTGSVLTVTWDPPSGEVNGYTFDLAVPGTIYYGGQTGAPANAYTMTFYPYGTVPKWVRVRTVNASGSSEPSDWVLVSVSRGRTARH